MHVSILFFFNDTATTEIYTLSLHDALPISKISICVVPRPHIRRGHFQLWMRKGRCCEKDRKSTRLNSSHSSISYAVFCLKKKKMTNTSSTCTSKKSPHRRPSITRTC